MTDGPIPIPLAGAPLPMRATQPAANGRQVNGQPVPEEVQRAAEEFEAVFLAEMMAPMFEGLDSEGLGGGGMGEQIFRPMLVERYAESITRSGGVGIADSIVRELMRMQEAQTPEADDGAAR